MARRRMIGPAYERSPIQRLSEWANRNILILISALVCGFMFWLLTDFVVDGVLNFLSTGGDETMEKPYDSNDPMWIITKLVGSSITMMMIVKSRSK